MLNDVLLTEAYKVLQLQNEKLSASKVFIWRPWAARIHCDRNIYRAYVDGRLVHERV